MKYKTSGVCSRSIDFDVVDNKVTNVAAQVIHKVLQHL